MIDELFEAFQLNVRERSVFSTLLGKEMQSASSVSKICGFARNTTRGILDALAHKGLVTRAKRGTTQYYGVESSESIIQTLRERLENTASEYGERIKTIERHSSYLSPRQKAQNKPRIMFYEGYTGLKKVYEDTLSSKSGLKSWGSFDANRQAIPKYFRTYYRRRAAKGIKMKSIHPDTPLTRSHMRHNRRELRKAVTVPKNRYTWAPEIQVYDDKVNIVSWKERIALIIESHEIADAVSGIFDLCFVGAQALRRK